MQEKKIYDIIIVGAGPAGLFSAYHLSEKNKSILVIDEGFEPLKRKEYVDNKQLMVNNISNIMSGVGGAGLFSDGKLNFIAKLGKTDLTEFLPMGDANQLIDDVEEIFKKFGMDGEVYPSDMEEAIEYKKKAKNHGVDLMIIKQKHLGSDKLPFYIQGMVDWLKNQGVEFKTSEHISEILVEGNGNEKIVKGVKSAIGNEYYANNVIAAPGRTGSKWLYEESKKHGLTVKFRGVEVGVRVEVPKEIMEKITSIIYDPTLFIYTDKYDDQVRTFCTNRDGFVAREDYNGKFVCVNGHAEKERKSQNANFAFLSKVNLTHPMTDTYKYGKSIGQLATTIGGGKPILQRFIDLKKGRRSTWSRLNRSYVTPTLKDVTPGDISMALPYRIVTNLIEGLEKLNNIIPGIASNSTLLYAPEIKFFSTQIESDNDLHTKIKGLFIAGDGAGVAGNIVGAAATGIIAAKGLLKQPDYHQKTL